MICWALNANRFNTCPGNCNSALMTRIIRPGMLSLTFPIVTERFMLPPCREFKSEMLGT